jgi:hypothetical protein
MIGSTKFTAEQKGRVDPDRWRYRITDVSMPDRFFYVTIRATQQLRPNVKDDIERWCALNSRKLPPDGETIHIDLDEVRRV